MTVHWTTSNGTAVSPTNYQAASGTLTIPAGATTGSIVVHVHGLSTVHGTTSFSLRLSAPTHASIATGRGTATGSIVYP